MIDFLSLNFDWTGIVLIAISYIIVVIGLTHDFMVEDLPTRQNKRPLIAVVAFIVLFFWPLIVTGLVCFTGIVGAYKWATGKGD